MALKKGEFEKGMVIIMKKKLLFALLGIAAMSALITGCRNNSNNTMNANLTEAMETVVEVDESERSEEVLDEKFVSVTYTTITTAEDWGPAIGKVVVNTGVAMDASTLSTDSFIVSAERKYVGMNWATFANEEIDEITERTITNVYVSDAEGNMNESGTYLTIEMQIGPAITAGSPFNYDYMSGLNSYVDTTYIIAMKDGAVLKDVNGNDFAILETTAESNAGNLNVLGDLFTTTNLYNYTDENKSIDLMYADFVPEMALEEGSTPLVIWLHGAGEGGTNPMIAILGNQVVNLATTEIQELFGETGALVLAPQTPTMWMDSNGEGLYLTDASIIDTDDGQSYYTEALMALVTDYVAAHPEIDTNRIYIGGCSNGGYMTVNMIIQYPEYFAAAYPVCEAYSVKWLTDEKIEKIKDLPIWLTAAKNDGIVAIYQGVTADDFVTYNLDTDESGEYIPLDDFSNALYNRLRNAGASDVHYSLFDDVHDMSGLYTNTDGTPYQYMGHWSWIYTLDNMCTEEIDGVQTTIFEWLSTQSK